MGGEYLRLLSFGPGGWGDELFSGLKVTVLLACATLPLGLTLGLVIAFSRRSRFLFVRWFGVLYGVVFRGLPELLTLLILYYGGQILLEETFGRFFQMSIGVSPFMAGMIALGLVFSAYASEVFFGVLQNLPQGEYEAARSLGLGWFQAASLVVFPRFLRGVLPGVSNLWLILLKETSLVSVIALDDLLRKTSVAVGVSKHAFFFYGVCCVIYFCLSLLSVFGIRRLERWSLRGSLS